MTPNRYSVPLRRGLLILGCAFAAWTPANAEEKTPAPVPAGDNADVKLIARVEAPGLASADIPPKKADDDTDKPKEAPKTPVLRSPFSFHMENFLGVTNITGRNARNNDGAFAGYGMAAPSNMALNWQGEGAHMARVSIGLGDMYMDRHTPLKQPVELFYSCPTTHGTSLTAGKFYVPFGYYQNELESKYGMMLQGSRGGSQYTGTLNYNFDTKAPNAYFQMSRQLTPRTNLTLSTAFGKGIFSGTSHSAAVGAAMTHNFGALELSCETNLAESPHGLFSFAYGKAALTKLGNAQPYIAGYYWHDGAHEQNTFNSAVLGMDYRLTRFVTLESAYARSNGKNVFWLQSHLNF